METEENSSDIMPQGFATVSQSLLHLANSFSEKGFNTIPFEGSWTAAQVIDHITKSNKSIAQALSLEGKPADRKPDERTPELAKIFLDFKTKLKSPDFILPTQDIYQKASLIATLESSIEKLKEGVGNTSLIDAIEHQAFGEITKLELLYFVVYHTQRHMHQLQHIYEIVENKQYKLLSFLFRQPLVFF
ncbi:MAG: DinB family protein [Taibaiella sp.]|jgi:hypothetical protein